MWRAASIRRPSAWSMVYGWAALTAWALASFLVASAPPAAHAQIFLASNPHPGFTVGPLFLRASVSPELGPVTVDILWSLVLPPGRSAAEVAQDLYLFWPGPVVGRETAGKPDPDLARYVEARGFTVIDEGQVALLAHGVRQMGRDVAADPPAGGAPFVTFVREGGPLGLTAPATYVRIPWTPRLANRDWLMNLRLTLRNAITPRKAGWFENVFWGERHLVSISFNDVRHQALFPMYLEHRDRVVRLADEPSQILINFPHSDRLKIDEVSPPSSSRRLSESLESTEVVSLFLDRSEGITPQVLTVQFGYFSGVQAWAPVLIPTLFFVLGNLAGVLVRTVAERLGKSLAGRVHFGPPSERGGGRQSGVVLSREVLARIVPGTTTADEVRRLCGPDTEQLEKLAAPDRRTLVYRGRRVVPQPRRTFGWLTTVGAWDVEDHEVEIELEREVVKDLQARVRRSRLERVEGG
jgi:hypothetical protein